MSKRIYVVLVAALAALPFAGTAEAAPHCDGHHQQCQHRAAARAHKRARAARQRARARRRSHRPAVAYVCPMHPDIRERSRGTCPKCLMDLVADPPGTKVNPRGEGAGAASSGGM